MDIHGRTFLEHLLDFYGPHVDCTWLLGGHLGEQLHSYASRRVQIVTEPTRLDTGGAVLAALDRTSEQFMVANGDTLFVGLNVPALIASATGVPATAAVLRTSTAGRGYIEVKGNRALRFREKDGPPEGWVYAGLAVFHREALCDFSPGCVSLERDILPALAERGQLRVWPFEGRLYDIGTPEGLEAFRLYRNSVPAFSSKTSE